MATKIYGKACNVDIATAYAQLPLLTEVAGDAARWISVLADANIAVGDAVLIDADGGARPITTTLAKPGMKVGVSEVVITSGSYGFVKIAGTVELNVAASCAADSQLHTTATAGRLDDAITDGVIMGIRMIDSATGAGLYTASLDEPKVNYDNALDSSITSAINALSLGTAAQADTGDFATAAQGGLADSALQAGDRTVVLIGDDLDVIGANAKVKRFVSPVAGTIVKIYSVLNSALATGDATITAAIAGTPVTSGVITITQDASAAGDIDSATPSAANVVTAGQLITLTVGGTNDQASSTANVFVVIEH